MRKLLGHIKGDKVLWGLVVLMGILSFMPVYSAASNLEFVVNNGTTISHLFKHAVMVFIGLAFMTLLPLIEYKWFGNLSFLMLVGAIILLFVTAIQGDTIGGANASRWLRFGGFSVQTSTVASLALMIYTARYLYDHRDKEINLKDSFWKIWIPIFLVVGLIFPANFSSAALVFLSVITLLALGSYPFSILLGMGGVLCALLGVFILLTFVLPEDVLPNRVGTWKSRIESYMDEDSPESYQVEKAKIAIATGGLTGLGPGKSVQKNFLPQSSSDFIFAIIIEEYGLVGGLSVLAFYFLMLQRIVIIARKATTVFGTLLVIGLGLPILFQAIINMAVATNLMPVTGQTLPFVSSGGTSMWITCIAVGMILSVSAATQKQEELEKELEKESQEDIMMSDNPELAYDK
ncbi:MAG: FtsW/RodA/SpoVE family cell cycle protein [Flavobacteriaceae bacterium]